MWTLKNDDDNNSDDLKNPKYKQGWKRNIWRECFYFF